MSPYDWALLFLSASILVIGIILTLIGFEVSFNPKIRKQRRGYNRLLRYLKRKPIPSNLQEFGERVIMLQELYKSCPSKTIRQAKATTDELNRVNIFLENRNANA